MAASARLRVPISAVFRVVAADGKGLCDLTANEVFAAKKVVLVGMPGAFTQG
ncbi:unnamed protein product [Amoebophrya sp. A25]|nr:unnamed protein product [Amoebophrya sp. A25]|eukprot:GSA25T00007678001.1